MKRMKKVFVTMLTIGALSMVGSNGAVAKNTGYGFSFKNATVYMESAAKNLIKKAGKPKAKKTAKSCAYKGKDRTYKYKDFILYTYSNSSNGPEFVNGITFLTNKVSTKEGIHIGSTWDDVKAKYGSGTDNFGIYTYKKGKCKLQIEVENDKVKNIRYVKIK